MEKSIRFYEEVLGLAKEESVDMGDHVIQYFRFHDNNTLELIKYKYETAVDNACVDAQSVYRHIAFRVDSVDEAYNVLKQEKDIEILMQPAFCENLNFTNFLIKDPNGVEVEILERNSER